MYTAHRGYLSSTFKDAFTFKQIDYNPAMKIKSQGDTNRRVWNNSG